MTIKDLVAYLELDATKKLFTKGVPYETQKSAILAVFSEKENLLKCSDLSIKVAIGTLADYGMSLLHQEVYFTANSTVCSCKMMYKGVLRRLIEAGHIFGVTARDVIYKGEKYRISLGEVVEHEQDLEIRNSDNKEIIAGYIIAQGNGGIKFNCVMNKSDIKIRKDQSPIVKGGRKSPKWDLYPEEGYYISCVSRLHKMITGSDPVGFDGYGVDTETGEVIETQPSIEQNEELEV
jgi:hypothetical protein